MKTKKNNFSKFIIFFLMFASIAFSQSELLPPGNVTFGLNSPGCFILEDPNGVDYFSMCLPDGKVRILKDLVLEPTGSPDIQLVPATGIVYKGSDRFLHDYNGRVGVISTNTFLGRKSGTVTAVGFNLGTISNTGIGYASLTNLSEGSWNTALGVHSLFYNTDGYYNTAVGAYCMSSNTWGAYNTAVGPYSLGHVNTGNNNVALGYNSGSNITTGNNNIAIGIGTSVPDGTADNQVRIGNDAITSACIVVPWSCGSDRTLKSNILNSNLGLNFITNLRPVSYTRNNDEKQRTEFGFIAQEVEEVLKESDIDNSGMITIDDEGMYSMRYNDLLAPMVKAIQELKAENDILKQNNEKLEVSNANLKTEVESLMSINEKIIMLEKIVNELTSVKHILLTGKEVNLTNSK